MTRRKSKLSTLSIFGWFCHHMAIVLGIIPRARRSRKSLIKRCNRRCLKSSVMHLYRNLNSKSKMKSNRLAVRNNNNNRNVENIGYEDRTVNQLAEMDQRRMICVLVENSEIAEWLQHTSVLKNSQIIDLQELVGYIQSSTKMTRQDASTMTNTDQIASCVSSISQSEHTRRLKALEFIRIFLETNEEDFCRYLINQEHLCPEKSLAIYQMIKQFLKAAYPSGHVHRQNRDQYNERLVAVDDYFNMPVSEVGEICEVLVLEYDLTCTRTRTRTRIVGARTRGLKK